MAESPPWEPEAFVARTAEELHAATQSKYCPAPTCASFREVLRTDGRYAMVGLPCHVHALRKAQALLPKLRERIVLAIGLFCGPGPSFLMLEHLFARRGVTLDEVVSMSYRDKSVEATGYRWPGGILAQTRRGAEIRIPLAKYLYAQTLFTRRRCHVCPDYAGELADLSTGDAHLEAFWTEPGHGTYRAPSGRIVAGDEGWNATLVRTEAGAEWVDAARQAGHLDVEPLPIAELRAGMASPLFRKKVEFWPRMRLRKLMLRKAPRFPGLAAPPPLKLRHYLIPVVRMVMAEAVHSRIVRWILARLPERWLLKKVGMRQRLIKKAQEATRQGED